MHTFDLNNYPNLLPSISLSSNEIKEVVSLYKLQFYPERNKEVEWGIKLPMFVYSFYDFIVKNQKMPNQQELYDYYLAINKDFIANLNRPDLATGIKARLYRTYPSLVRDIYFNKYIEERIGSKCIILYNTKLDVEEGIDLMITTKRNNYGICFFTDTKRAYEGRKAKEHRHILFDNVKYVEMPMNFEGSVKAGDFFLYGEKEYLGLYNVLSK